MSNEEQPSTDAPVFGRAIDLTLSLSVSERQFLDVRPEYANWAHVAFDGVNFHLTFYEIHPEAYDPQRDWRAQVIARLVLPPQVAMATQDALKRSLQDPKIEGILSPLFHVSHEEEGLPE